MDASASLPWVCILPAPSFSLRAAYRSSQDLCSIPSLPTSPETGAATFHLHLMRQQVQQDRSKKCILESKQAWCAQKKLASCISWGTTSAAFAIPLRCNWASGLCPSWLHMYMEEKCQGRAWNKPVGTQWFQSHFCPCIKICLYPSSLLNISSFLLVYICTSSVQSALHQALIYWYSLWNVSSRIV